MFLEKKYNHHNFPHYYPLKKKPLCYWKVFMTSSNNKKLWEIRLSKLTEIHLASLKLKGENCYFYKYKERISYFSYPYDNKEYFIVVKFENLIWLSTKISYFQIFI